MELTKGSAGAELLEYLKLSQRAFVVIDTLDVFSAMVIHEYGSDVIDGAWVSSLGNSTRIGIPDVYNINVRDYSTMLTDLRLKLPEMPIVVDADNGGQSHKTTRYTFAQLANLGVSLGVIENKRGTKYNSIDQTAAKLHELEDTEIFAQKVNAAMKQNETMVAIRLENAIVNEDDLEVAKQSCMEAISYFNEHAKPHMYVIHWKLTDPSFIVDFGKAYLDRFGEEAPLLGCIPTTYSKNITNNELYEAGYKLLIYGNPLLRAQYQSIRTTLDQIRQAGGLKLVDENTPSPKEVFELIGD